MSSTMPKSFPLAMTLLQILVAGCVSPGPTSVQGSEDSKVEPGPAVAPSEKYTCLADPGRGLRIGADGIYASACELVTLRALARFLREQVDSHCFVEVREQEASARPESNATYPKGAYFWLQCEAGGGNGSGTVWLQPL